MAATAVGCFLTVLHAQDNRAGGEEEQCLEERMGYEVEHPGDVCAHANRGDHKAKLGDGGVSQHPLDIELPDGDRGGEERSGAPTQVTHDWAAGTGGNSGFERATRYTPAVTMVAAWISAETGVGPAMASGSQT